MKLIALIKKLGNDDTAGLSPSLHYIIVILLLLILSAFGTGYFFGKKKVLQEINNTLHHEIFADQLQTAVAMLCDQDMQESPINNNE